MKVLEVSTLHAGIDQVLNNIRNQREQLKQIERSIQAIVDLQDAFKGEGGQAIRGFFQSYHLSFLQDLLSFYDRYTETLEQIKNNLMALEPAADGFIRESYLEHEVFNGLETIKERIRSLTDETNQTISSVADIVALPKLDDSYVLHGITMADQQRDETIGKLHTFDQQQTSALLPLENTVRAMVQYVQQVSTLFQARNGSIPSIESVYYTQNFLQPNFSLFAYSKATLHKMSVWNHFYLNYLKSNPSPEVEQLISAIEAEALIRKATDRVQVIDEYNGFSEVSDIEGKYYTLPDGRILRQYYTPTGVYKYEYIDKIPEERIGGVKPSDEAVSLILDFVPIISNGKAALEAIIGEDIITGRKLSDVERSILVAAIVGGPLVKAVKVFGKTAMKQLPKVKNVLNPAKAKSFAKNLYDDFIKQGIDKGFSVAKSLAKKIADMPMPLSPKLATANGVPVTKTIGESMAEAKETIVQMAGKVKGSVAGKGTGNVPKVTKGYDVTPLKSTYQERLNQTPVNNGKWTGERGESTFISDKPEVKPYVERARVKGVEYKNAMPDLSPFSKAEFEITGMSSSRPSNFSKADELLAKQWSTPEKQWTKAEVAKWRAQNKYTWHELNDGKTVQLIPSSVNSKFGHLGGVSEVK